MSLNKLNYARLELINMFQLYLVGCCLSGHIVTLCMNMFVCRYYLVIAKFNMYLFTVNTYIDIFK